MELYQKEGHKDFTLTELHTKLLHYSKNLSETDQDTNLKQANSPSNVFNKFNKESQCQQRLTERSYSLIFNSKRPRSGGYNGQYLLLSLCHH